MTAVNDIPQPDPIAPRVLLVAEAGLCLPCTIVEHYSIIELKNLSGLGGSYGAWSTKVLRNNGRVVANIFTNSDSIGANPAFGLCELKDGCQYDTFDYGWNHTWGVGASNPQKLNGGGAPNSSQTGQVPGVTWYALEMRVVDGIVKFYEGGAFLTNAPTSALNKDLHLQVVVPFPGDIITITRIEGFN